MRRVGPKGAAEFEPISWDDAIEEIAHRFTRVIAQWGPEAILPFSYAGTLGRVQYYAGHPFFHALGASQLDRTICVSTAYAGWRATLGVVAGNDSEQMVGAELVVLWGINAAYTHINLMTLVKEARARGARIVCIDPYRTRTARQADEHLMIRSGTDGALALGLMHVLIREDLLDHGYIARATLGFEALREHVARLPARARGGDHRAARRRDRRPRAALRAGRGPLPPRGHRAVAARERRHDVPGHRVPARADGRLRPPARRRAPRELRRLRPRGTRSSSGGTSCRRRRRARSTWSSWGAR